MKLRKLAALALVAALCLSFGASALALAQANPDQAFLNDLYNLENFLRTNIGESSLGNNAVKFIKTSCPSMDVERLNRCLKTFLRCGDTVPLGTRLEAYAKDITSGYASMYEYSVENGTSPDVAADSTSFERGWYGAAYGATVSSPQESRDDCYRYSCPYSYYPYYPYYR